MELKRVNLVSETFALVVLFPAASFAFFIAVLTVAVVTADELFLFETFRVVDIGDIVVLLLPPSGAVDGALLTVCLVVAGLPAAINVTDSKYVEAGDDCVRTLGDNDELALGIS